MSTRKPGDGSRHDSDTETVLQALRRIAGDGDRVTLDQLVGETGLEPAAAEQAMGRIERVTPLRAKRIVEPGGVTWRVSL